jgi:phosphoenolpyruvate carboxykinase (GTP)
MDAVKDPVLTEQRATPTAAGGTSNLYVRQWVNRCIEMCQPDQVVWCDGSADERQRFLAQGVRDGIFIKLNQDKLPGCYLHRSNPNDVARSEHLTFICTPGQDMVGATNNWMESRAAYAKLRPLFTGCMKGRTMYVVPFVMGPIGSPMARVGVQLTDSLYVAVSMGIMTRMGDVAWQQLGDDDEFTRCLHSLGDVNPERRLRLPLPAGQHDLVVRLRLRRERAARQEVHGAAPRQLSRLPAELDGRAHAADGRDRPKGEKTYVAAAFPSSCGKTNFAMLIPPKKYQRAGLEDHDGRRRHRLDVGGQRRPAACAAINPEAGYFGVVPGTNEQTNPNAMRSMERDTIFTNVGCSPTATCGGKARPTPRPRVHRLDRRDPGPRDRQSHRPQGRASELALHRPMANNPRARRKRERSRRRPVNAIVFGGRRSKTSRSCIKAFNWMHGVYVGATLGSETTAAATGQQGVVRRDPMAMLPFIGYNIRDYLVHWFRMRKRMTDCPRIFHVNWFRRNDAGKFLWPGFGDNMRVLKWIIDRARGRAYAKETVVGWMPRSKDIDLEGINVTEADFDAIQKVDIEEFKNEILSQEELFLKLAGDLPKEMVFQRELLISRL